MGRIDKYLMLVRKYCEVAIKLLQRENSRPEAVTAYSDALLKGPLE